MLETKKKKDFKSSVIQKYRTKNISFPFFSSVSITFKLRHISALKLNSFGMCVDMNSMWVLSTTQVKYH